MTTTITTLSGTYKYCKLEFEFADGHRESAENAVSTGRISDQWLRLFGATRLWGTRVDTGDEIRLLPVIEISLAPIEDYFDEDYFGEEYDPDEYLDEEHDSDEC